MKARLFSVLSIFLALALLAPPRNSAVLAQSSGRYEDGFDAYLVGSPLTGWTPSGDAPVMPTVQDHGGSGPPYRGLSFPPYTAQPAAKWLIKEGYHWNNTFARVYLEFQTESDGAGLVLD